MNKNKKTLILGGAQFGFNYGSPKYNKKIKKNDLDQILKIASKKGIIKIDTARAYKDSEKNIGIFLSQNKKMNFKIFSKLDSIKKINKKNKKEITYEILQNIYQSLKFLNLNKLEGVAVRDVKDFFKKKFFFIECFDILKKEKFIKGFGVSIYTPEELYKSLSIKNISYIQMPINILDNRWNFDKIRSLKQRKTKIYVRSVFLRGLLFLNFRYWPKWIRNKIELKNKLKRITKRFNKKNVVDLTFSYLNSLNFIDGIIFGFNSIEQFKNIIKYRNSEKLSKLQLKMLSDEVKFVDKRILDARNY